MAATRYSGPVKIVVSYDDSQRNYRASVSLRGRNLWSGRTGAPWLSAADLTTPSAYDAAARDALVSAVRHGAHADDYTVSDHADYGRDGTGYLVRRSEKPAARPNDFAAVGDLRDRVYYHGTTRTASAEAIWRDGFKPPEVKKPRGQLAPVPGRVYLTPHVSYAMIYAIGGDMAGGEPYMPSWVSDPYGYVFAVRGSDMTAIQPDEDSVGEMVASAARGDIDVPWLWRLAVNKLTDNQLRKVKEGEYNYWAQAGKKLVKLMSPAQQEELVRLGAHVAQVGSVMPFAAWRLDRRRMAELRKDGSNFFDIAEPWGEPRTRPNHHGGYHAPGDPLGNYERRAVIRSSSGKDRVVTFQRAMRQPGGIIMLDPGGKGPASARTMMFVRESSLKSIEGPIENL